MDPVTHAVVGRLTVALDRRADGAAGSLLPFVAAIAPDADAVLMPVGWDVYLRAHQAGTHSLAGALAIAFLLGAVTAAWHGRPSGPFVRVAAIGVFTHVALDVLSGATIQLLWPISSYRTAGGLVAMSDPWFVAPVAVALGVVLFMRRRFADVAPATVAVLLVLLALKGVSRHLAVQRFADATSAGLSTRYVEAEWGSLTGWWIYGRDGDRLRAWRVDALRERIEPGLDVPAAGAAAAETGARRLSTVANFLRVHELPLRVEIPRGAVTRELWSDLRFCWRPEPGEGPPAGSTVRPAEAGPACAVWFGGDLDADGAVVRRIVTIGGYTQVR